jgi:phosphoribosylformylglycinamidine synthase
MDLKEPGHQLFLLGQTLPELGGSVYFDAMGLTDGVVPEVDANAHMARARALYAAINAGEVRACHDCSEGGVLTALAEMALAGGLGAELELGDVAPEWRDDVAMFSESSGRYVVAVATEHRDTFAERFAEAGPITAIGRVTREPTLTVERRGERDAIAVSLCTEAWFQGEDT